MPVGEADGFIQGIGEGRAAIRIDSMVTAMGAVGDRGGLERHRPGRGRSDEQHIPIRHDGGLHADLFVVTFRHIDMGIRQGVGAKERRQPAEVGDAVRDLVMGADLRGGDEFAAVALTVVDR